MSVSHLATHAEASLQFLLITKVCIKSKDFYLLPPDNYQSFYQLVSSVLYLDISPRVPVGGMYPEQEHMISRKGQGVRGELEAILL